MHAPVYRHYVYFQQRCIAYQVVHSTQHASRSMGLYTQHGMLSSVCVGHTSCGETNSYEQGRCGVAMKALQPTVEAVQQAMAATGAMRCPSPRVKIIHERTLDAYGDVRLGPWPATAAAIQRRGLDEDALRERRVLLNAVMPQEALRIPSKGHCWCLACRSAMTRLSHQMAPCER